MMLKGLLGLAALLGVTVAEPIRERRQSGCVDAFQNVPNVCQNNPTGQLFFAHPTDPTKFMQCDVYNRMFIIQCPAGEVFVATTSGCQPRNTVTVAPVTNPPITRPPVTAAPITVAPATGNNPCTAQAVARGQLYFNYPGDNTRFYECDLLGDANVLSCPQGLVWDQSVLSCVYPVDASKPVTGVNPTQSPSTVGITGGNPCTSQAISAGRLFFPHPDTTKFIQCDLWGDFFVNSCPNKLVWNAYLETCYSPFLAATGVGK